MFLKIRKIVKEAIFVLIVAFIFLCLINSLLHIIPKSRTPIDITITASKIGILAEPFPPLSSTVNPVEIGITDKFPITIKGYYVEYFFNKAKLDVEISSFDGLINFRPADMNWGPGRLLDDSMHGYARMRTTYLAEHDGRTFVVTVNFTKDLDNWLFTATGYDAFAEHNQLYGKYAASTSGDQDLAYYSEVFYPVDFSKGWENAIIPG